MANSWDYAKKSLPYKSRQAMGGNALPFKEQQLYDLLNEVGGDTSTDTYHHTASGQPIPAAQRADYNPSMNRAPSPAASMDISAGPPIPPAEQPRIPQMSMPAYAKVVAKPFNSGAPEFTGAGSADDRFQENRRRASDFYSRVVADPISDVPRGSGQDRKNTSKLVRDDKAVRTEATFVSPVQWDEAQANFRKLPEIDNIRKNQQEMEDLVKLGLEHSTARPDLGVLKDFTKNISNGKITMDGYNAPKPAMDAGTALAVLGNRNKGEENILKQAADAISNQKGGTLLESFGTQGSLDSEDSASDARRFQPRQLKGEKGYDPTKDIKELGKERSKYSAPILNGMNQLDAIFSKAGWAGGLKEAQEELASQGKLRHDVPGVGGVKSIVGSIAPGLLSNEGSPLYATLKNMALAKLQQRSGQQASADELRKYLADFGLTPGAGDREVVNGLGRMIADMKNSLHSDEARFDPRAVNIYKTRPGRIMSTDFDRFVADQKSIDKALAAAKALKGGVAGAGPVQGPPSPPGQTPDTSAIDKELADIEAKLKAKKGGK